ncbi:MAG: hypothetical protein J6R54_01865 [Bacteroidaceae bacterium]|nr:hypothetical protein [Bacteroidaceae bacterium]
METAHAKAHTALRGAPLTACDILAPRGCIAEALRDLSRNNHVVVTHLFYPLSKSVPRRGLQPAAPHYRPGWGVALCQVRSS